MSYFDEWYEHGQARGRAGSGGVRYVERREGMLSPQWDSYGNSLQRTRSVGHAPAPNVQIINRNDDHSRSPPRGRDRSRSHSRYAGEEDIADEIAGLRADMRRNNRSRSRSQYRDHSPGYAYPPPQPQYAPAQPVYAQPLYAQPPPPPPAPANNGVQDWQLEHIYRDGQDRINYEREVNRKRMEIARLEERIQREDEESKMKSYSEQIEWKAEKARLRSDAKAKADKEEEEESIKKALRDRDERDRKDKEARDRALKDWKYKQEEEDRERKDAEKRAVKDYEYKHEQEEKERKDAAKRAIEAYERKKREEKEEKEKMKLQFKLEEEQERKEAIEKQKAWELQQVKKAEEAKKKKKEEEDRIEAEMHKRLGKFGLQENQIAAMLNPEEKNRVAVNATSSNALVFKQPKYFKVHKDYLSIETLRYYKIPYDDNVEKDYIVILQEMDSEMTEILFAHTKRHRESQLFIEDRGRKNEPSFAFVRKKSKSRSRSRVPAERIWRVG